MSVSKRLATLEADLWDFSPAILQAQHAPPSPLPRLILYTLLALVAILLLWAAVLGRAAANCWVRSCLSAESRRRSLASNLVSCRQLTARVFVSVGATFLVRAEPYYRQLGCGARLRLDQGG